MSERLSSERITAERLKDWQEAIALVGIDPEKILVLGDNISGDIQATARVGVRYRIWIPSSWKIYNSGEIPEGTIVAENIGKVVETLIGFC